ncbi:MAG: hypothetical protein JRE70_04715 [Deltaproteobacteria bacterium]|nr:hypothetical protein [Deltaproteobacteria bacterium]
MKSIGIAIIGLFLSSQIAAAAPSWAQISFTTTSGDAPKILAAAEALMSSDVGKEFPGKLLLQILTADGDNPATHMFVPIYKSAAEREGYVQKLQADPAWTGFTAVMGAASQPVSTVLYRNVGSWGDINETDHVWAAHAFAVDDPAAFQTAIEKYLDSKTGKKFPGQVYLSAVVAGGISPVSHVISVGYASEAEMDAWIEDRNGTKDWANYQDDVEGNAEFLGTSLARDVKSWGLATLEDITSN